ncbi:MAG: hypothetical protein KatS3mg111_2252 [Pirellulaceae bacterium]|nr:MAG: hypothetical protein KatS3mg111_2252 [Pirellulaceae bacterium]
MDDDRELPPRGVATETPPQARSRFLALAGFPTGRYWQDQPPGGTRRRPVFVAVLAFVLLSVHRHLEAGISPAETVVVVNGESFNSWTVANHFIHLRDIPPNNVIVLRNVPSSEEIDVATFRQRILQPLLQELDRRQLAPIIQCVAYSADFPTAIDISADLEGLGELPKIYTRKASINGLTYLYMLAHSANPAYVLPVINFYARRELDAYFSNPGGSATKERWEAVERAQEEGNHQQAIAGLIELLDDQPYQFPLAYLLAAHAAAVGDTEQALRWFSTAVERGWIAGGYLEADDRFAALRGNPEFEVLRSLLDPEIKSRQWPSGFEAQRWWCTNGVPIAMELVEEDPQTHGTKYGVRFLLCTVLAVTRGNGLRLPEAVAALERSAKADFTHPDGEFYFCVTDDIRTLTRASLTPDAIDQLRQLGYQARLIPRQLPVARPRVLGVQFGTPSFSWDSCQSQLMPGAIADNLTSVGGVMGPRVGQTNLSELIRAGAAGSSGTVVEPYAIANKFPSPFLYVYYARGASLAEAFYLSVTGPYQLLIVGDPLCRPFSHAPRPVQDEEAMRRLHFVTPDSSVRVELNVSGPTYANWEEVEPGPLASRKQHLAPTRMRLLRDGKLIHDGAPIKNISVTADGLTAGYHRVDVIAIADDPLSQRDSVGLGFWVGDPKRCTLEFVGNDSVDLQSEDGRFDLQMSLRATESLVIQVVGPSEAKRVSLWRDAEQLAVSESDSGQFAVEVNELGLGPVRLFPKAELDDGRVVSGRPYWIEVLP